MSRVVVTGVWLRKRPADARGVSRVEVLLEMDGRWRRVLDQATRGGDVVSRVVEPAGILASPVDDLPGPGQLPDS